MKYGRLEIITKQLSQNLALERGEWRGLQTGVSIPAKTPSVPQVVKVFSDPRAYLDALRRSTEYFVFLILGLLCLP
jgi:hypothetical protein